MSINVSRRIMLLFMRKLKNSLLHAFPPSIFDLSRKMSLSCGSFEPCKSISGA